MKMLDGTEREIPEALKQYQEFVGKSIIGGGFSTRISPNAMNAVGADIRDTQIWKYPILPGAVSVFQQMSSGREWQIIGKAKAALRAVEWLNNAKRVDPFSGLPVIGFENFLRLRALDFISIGRTSFGLHKRRGNPIPELRYLDPTLLVFQRDLGKNQITVPAANSVVKEVTNSEKCWYHNGYYYRYDEVTIDHALPIGTSGLYISPLAYILPAAMLAFLVRDHDTASTDGRRIRDIVVVGSPELSAGIEQAILTQLALYSGGDASKLGIPIVEMNNLSGQPIKDQVFTMGLSQIPEGFDRESFIFEYVNEIAAALGLSLRHFWNNERTTNRALEEIQEQRQAQKGPSTFVRTEQRLINACGALDLIGGGKNSLTFSFVEEADTGSALKNAQVLQLTTTALASVAQVFQASLSLDALLAWMQSIRVLPNDLDLITMGDSEDQESEILGSEGHDMPDPSEDQQITEAQGTPPPKPPVPSGAVPPPKTPSPQSGKKSAGVPDYDEVSVDQYGNIKERRHKIFSTRKMLKSMLEDEANKKPQVVEDFSSAVKTQQLNNQQKVSLFFETNKEIEGDFIPSVPFFDNEEVRKAVFALTHEEELTAEQAAIIDLMASTI